MPKSKSSYVCQSCGSIKSKWSGRCEDCGEWNTLQEEATPQQQPGGLKKGKAQKIQFQNLETHDAPPPRIKTSIGELDRVLGGGLVKGGVLLIGGNPGIGKSTLLLQTVAKLAEQGHTTVYVSGEEGTEQITLRAERLGLKKAPVALAVAASVRDIVAALENNPPDVAVIDSIQTLYLDSIESAPGSVSQVRASVSELTRIAKRKNICLILVGHVTREGTIAGPKVVEHMVDTVLQFNESQSDFYRILRALKNRFGPAHEIGVFEMAGNGMMEVKNPSELFFSHENDVNGTAVFASCEGSRPLLVEVQALVAPSPLAQPRRATVGWDHNRLSMILAVLEVRGGVKLSHRDVYLNVAGGLKLSEPAADCAVAMALMSCVLNHPLPDKTVVMGELGLGGEVRPVNNLTLRLQEAEKLGFTQAIIPDMMGANDSPLKTRMVKTMQDLVHLLHS